MSEMRVEEFIEGWKESSLEARAFFVKLKEATEKLSDVSFSFTARPGVSFSLRPQRGSQKTRGFFAIIDVIDDDPADRWLSVCFYADTITDPEQKGDMIPGGLAEGDGYCFDVYNFEDELFEYLMARIEEAWKSVDGK